VGTYLNPIVAKADPSLFKNSLYVQAVNRTGVRLCIIYSLFPYIYQHFDFETFAIGQEIVSLFFILAGIFALTKTISGSSIAGYVAMFLYTAELNNWTLGSPSPYLNFFHHSLPYAYPLMVWSMVFFFQKRYQLALMLAGISWNFHPMCTMFLLFTYFIFWIFNRSEFNQKTVLSCILAFIVTALPTLIKTPSYLNEGTPYDPIWLTVARWTAWYTCFPSTWPLSAITRAGLFLILFLIALLALPNHHMRKGILTFTISIGIMCLLGTVFADLYPIPFIIKLSLWRSTIIYLFLALPCIGYLLVKIIGNPSLIRCLVIITAMVLLTGYYGSPLTFSHGDMRLLLFLSLTIIFFFIHKVLQRLSHLKYFAYNPWILVIGFIILFDLGVLYSKGGPGIYYHGRIQGKIDPWADIQMFAQKHSVKDDIFIVPPYLNDFGIYSLRATLGDWAEGGNAIYLDNQFALEWFSRMNDLGWKKFSGEREGYNNLTTEEIRKAAKKYGVKYVVTEKPKTFELKKIYENEKFISYGTL
jgi:hypothetical protein